jgi:hypothetical protein
MPSKPAREHGVLSRLRGWLRGDRYMVDAWPPVSAPAPAAAPAAPAAAPSRAERKD